MKITPKVVMAMLNERVSVASALLSRVSSDFLATFKQVALQDLHHQCRGACSIQPRW